MKSSRRQFYALMRLLKVTQTVRLIRRKLIYPLRRSWLDPAQRSASIHIFHCTIQKAGSQWIKQIFSDARTFEYSGLAPFSYYKHIGGDDPRKLTERTIEMQFPRYTIVTPLYLDFTSFQTIPKSENYKAFFIMRDPRDLVVSWYFSTKYSHRLNHTIARHRAELNRLSEIKGLIYAIDYLEEVGIFPTLRSWVPAPQTDPNVLLVRFEDLIAPDNFKIYQQLFSHCDIRLPENLLVQILNDYSFKKLKSRESQQKESEKRHYRKGKAGDWKNYFDEPVLKHFEATTGDLVQYLGYPHNY